MNWPWIVIFALIGLLAWCFVVIDNLNDKIYNIDRRISNLEQFARDLESKVVKLNNLKSDIKSFKADDK